MGRRFVPLVIVGLLLAGGGFAAYSWWAGGPARERIAEPVVPETGKKLPTQEEFERLARENPVAMLEACLRRYEQAGVKGCTATLEKHERVQGDLHDPEIVQLTVAGEVPEHPGEQPNIRVRMIWKEGFRSLLGVKSLGTLYPNPAAKNRNEMVAYTSLDFTKTMKPKDYMARNASRYCITDAGLFRGMLRTYDAWKKRQAAGRLHAEYLGTRAEPRTGGRPCHVIHRSYPTPEVDSFAIDEAPDPKADPQRDGATDVTVYIDAERWLQVGTVLKRAGGDLLGEYYFRDVELSTTDLSPNPFTVDALKAATKK